MLLACGLPSTFLAISLEHLVCLIFTRLPFDEKGSLVIFCTFSTSSHQEKGS